MTDSRFIYVTTGPGTSWSCLQCPKFHSYSESLSINNVLCYKENIHNWESRNWRVSPIHSYIYYDLTNINQALAGCLWEALSLEPKLLSPWCHSSGPQLRPFCPQGTRGKEGAISCTTGTCCWNQWAEARGAPTQPSRAGRSRPPQPCHWLCNQEGSTPRPQCPWHHFHFWSIRSNINYDDDNVLASFLTISTRV